MNDIQQLTTTQEKMLCPECGKLATERIGMQKYLYGGKFHLYTSKFFSCENGRHEFQTSEQLQYSIDECNKIKKAVNEDVTKNS